jgi:hypothetical protein
MNDGDSPAMVDATLWGRTCSRLAPPNDTIMWHTTYADV